MAIIDTSSGTYRSIYGGPYGNIQNELEEVMELKEARKCAENIRLHKAALISGATNYPLTIRDEACLALDDRIIELEAENEILLQQALDRENWKASAEEALGRITELEKEMIKTDNNATSWQNNYYNLANAIHEAVVAEKNQERDIPEKELKQLVDRVKELGDQCALLYEATNEMLNLIENSDFDVIDGAPNTDDMNRWHRALQINHIQPVVDG